MGDLILGKIYILKSPQTDKIYIGSTTRTLNDRLIDHRSQYNKFMNNKLKHKSSSIELMKYDDIYIELIKEIQCTKKELLKVEGEEIRRNNKAVNIISYDKIFDKSKQEYMKKYMLEYRKTDKYKIITKQNSTENSRKARQNYEKTEICKQYRRKQKEMRREIKTVCPCGGKYSLVHKARHFKSKLHENYYII